MTAKATVRALLERLPEDCSLGDVLCHLYEVQAVSRGMADAEGWAARSARRGRGSMVSSLAPRLRTVVWADSAQVVLDEVTAYSAEDSRQAAVDVLDAALHAAGEPRAALGARTDRP